MMKNKIHVPNHPVFMGYESSPKKSHIHGLFFDLHPWEYGDSENPLMANRDDVVNRCDMVMGTNCRIMKKWASPIDTNVTRSI
jgi:hypothetical protein